MHATSLTQLGWKLRIFAFALLSWLLLVEGHGAGLFPSLEWRGLPGGRSARLEPKSTPGVGFAKVPSEQSGVDFLNPLGEQRSLTNHILMNGSGVALGDVDGDGLCDIFFAGLSGSSALFKNLGNWRFTNITSLSFGAASENAIPLAAWDASGAVFADLDGDRDLDLLLNTVGAGVRSFRNDGSGRFIQTTAESGLSSRSGGSSLALADIDGDGDLDLYAVNYRSSTMRDAFQLKLDVRVVDGRPVVAGVDGKPASDPELAGRFTVDEEGRITEHGEADQLYLNDGRGSFRAVPFTGGSFLDERGQALALPLYDWGLAAMFRDINGDGAPDLYVCNDLNSPDRVWINNGKGGFRAMERRAVRKTSWFSMGVDFGDLNRDGFLDFFVTDMLSRDPVRRHVQVAHKVVSSEDGDVRLADSRPQVARNTLFAGRGDGTFAEIAHQAGLAASDWSWSPVFLDVDLDGYEDILITTGFGRDVQDADVADQIETERRQGRLSQEAALRLRLKFPKLALPAVAFRNLGGFAFRESGKDWGFDMVGVSQGMALADLDSDGDLDVVINQQNAPAILLRNESTAPRLLVSLKGSGPNSQGIGARVEVEGGAANVRQVQEMISGGRFLSSDQAVRVFAVGSLTNRLSVTVHWRSGRRSELRGVEPDSLLEVDESQAAGAAQSQSVASNPAPWFQDVSSLLNHTHAESKFQDQETQPLLSRGLSRLGPAAVWTDVNLDGADDLVIGAPRGGRMGVFVNDGAGRFRPDVREAFRAAQPFEHAAMIAWAAVSNRNELLVGFSNYEIPDSPSSLRTVDLVQGLYQPRGARMTHALGPMALTFAAGQGRWDLFLGGRAVSGQYPSFPVSGLLSLTNNLWMARESTRKLMSKFGLITGAVFSDVDRDGDADLLISAEWGALRLLENRGGEYFDADPAVSWAGEGGGVRFKRLSEMTGWWNSITTADVNNDGLPDVIAGNWGLNSRHGSGPGFEQRLYAGDLDGNGTWDMVETELNSGTGREVPWATLDVAGRTLPQLSERFLTRRQYGEAGAAAVLQAAGGNAPAVVLRAVLLESVVLLNRGDHFDCISLPPEAQRAPVFGIAVSDFDADGNEDLFLAQNFHDVLSDGDRLDAGTGLILAGNGKGGFRALAAAESGIRLEGEQRAAAVADFNGDSRADLVVTQSGGATRLYRGSSQNRGLKVELLGPVHNPGAVGAALRLEYADGTLGPLREVRVGGGYWSQDSLRSVLGKSGPVRSLRVNWPDGRTDRQPLKDEMQFIRVSH